MIERLTDALADRYRLERELGAGGMATVYLAHDLKHERDVAIKVLHQDLAAALGAERFLAEIKTTAKLQHPHILPLLDSGEAAGLLYYVMPYVAGESLRDRLTREKQLPIDDAVRIAREVADALGHAHGHGIIHRDIKPENILLQEGHALVADFGIALAVQSAGGQRMTQTGLSLGTPQYMSPEQAMGEKAIDLRADIYALGAVTYEMLTGEPPFTGATVQAIVSKVMATEPTRPTEVRKTIPPHVEAAVLTALAKLPADRFSAAREFAESLAGAGAAMPRVAREASTTRPIGRALGARLRDPVTVVLGLSLLGAVAVLLTLDRSSTVLSAAPVRFELSVPDSEPVENLWPWPAAISPSGTTVVYAGRRGATTQLFMHRTDALEAYAIPGTEGATQPIFSPDGEWIAVETLDDDARGKGGLRKMRLDGSGLMTIANARANNGADWSVKDEIVLGSEGGTRRGLLVVSASGGELRSVTQPDSTRGELDHLWPIVAADGQSVAFVIWHGVLATSELAMTRLDDGQVRPLGLKGIRTLAVLDDELVYLTAEGVVMAVRVNLHTGRVTAPPVPLHEGIPVAKSNGNSGVFVSRLGALVHLSRARGRLVWRAPNMRPQALTTDVRSFQSPMVSLDGRRVVVEVGTGSSTDIWVYDVRSGAAQRLTSTGHASLPVWSADGAHVLFASSTTGGRAGVWRQRADGGDAPALLFETSDLILAIAATRDGKWLAIDVLRDNNNEILLVPASSNQSSRPYLNSRALEMGAQPSPDERHMAYVSDGTGRLEVYVDTYPTTSSRVQVSPNGGVDPRWSPDGKVLYYREGARLIAASVTTTPGFRVLARDTLQLSVDGPFSVAPDGKRFLSVERGTDALRLVVVTNWMSEVRQRTSRENRSTGTRP